MAEPVTNDRAQRDLLAQVQEGMEVYDSTQKKVGKVNSLYMGALADVQAAGGGMGAEAMDDDSFIGDISRAFGDRVPAVMRNRMRTNGFIRVHGGLLKGDRIALREHIAAVAGGRVILNVRGEELIGA